MTTTKVCIVCKLTFADSKHPHKRTCSRKCAGLLKRKPIIAKRCPTCNKEFTSSNKFCSIECARPSFASRKGKVLTRQTKICVVCGATFETVPTSSKQFCCSRKCQSERRRRPKELRNCIHCGNTFKAIRPHTRFCSRRCGSLHRFIDHVHHIQPKDAVPRNKMLKCCRCGFDQYPKILERHHKDRNPKNNSPDNIDIVCPNCHDIDHLLAKDGKFRTWA